MLQQTWQDTIAFTADQLLVGTGWYAVEKQDETYFRWVGPDPTATIHLVPSRDQAKRINLTLPCAADEEILSALRVEADGIPLAITLGQGRDPVYITAVLPSDPGKAVNQETVLSFILPRTLPGSEALNDPKDKRSLGIALERIDIFPMARSLFTANKYADPTPFDGLNYIRYNPFVRDAVLHGLHASAYDYFLEHNRQNEQTAFALHPQFDECPGDVYDILHYDMQQESTRLERKHQDEIKLLREMLYRQGDMIRELQTSSIEKK